MSKYIVKNCPAKVDLYCYTEENRQKFVYCQDCTDCLIKQVIEKCKETLSLMQKDCSTNAYAGGRCTEAEGILQMFDIEEYDA